MPKAILTVLLLTASCAGSRPGLDGGADAAVSDGPSADTRTADAASCASDAAGTSGCGTQGGRCCDSPAIPSATYFRTYANDGGSPTGEADPATVSRFRLDSYLVTVGRFRRFVGATAAGWTPPAGSGKHLHVHGGRGLADSSAPGYEPGWSAGDTITLPATAVAWSARLDCDPSFGTWTDEPGANETLPINCIDWYEAYAFCIWDGGFLPSEAEWELAAAGGTEQRAFPWGSTAPTGELYLISDCDYPAGATGCSGAANIAPVGTTVLGAGRWGQLDLAGELAEWTLDYYAPYVDPCTDCVFLTDYSYRVVRGGSFGTDTDDLSPWARDGDLPESRNAFYGARCARSP
ncbi:MAG TPA: formylglycine-generating enzyme family protein [Polyangia bacterium]|jgi:formylglycine-generating enzyme required for sulfatase activity